MLERVVLSALDGAACRLNVSREELVLALTDERSLDAFAAEHGISRRTRSTRCATASCVQRMTHKKPGALSAGFAQLVRNVVQRIPPRLALALLEQLQRSTG